MTTEQHTATASTRESHVTSEGNSLVSSVALTTILFVLFVAGLYVMSLYTVGWYLFLVGLAMCLVSLFITFTAIPKYMV
ncbi:hypothetical protein [Brachybacterium phenoliresistens]|uniref:Uncharacterized protein n=1 Tax=Brachybacterium phenoliresistens TaxID=396014 RepID=Z9JNY6_9MICO|nr:hypothetical protein [Brachybacterium phenoliresistens]EWS79899.1 hypothetical protein BF93_08820 [Brachybacterium phenoliresistens]